LSRALPGWLSFNVILVSGDRGMFCISGMRIWSVYFMPLRMRIRIWSAGDRIGKCGLVAKKMESP